MSLYIEKGQKGTSQKKRVAPPLLTSNEAELATVLFGSNAEAWNLAREFQEVNP